MEKLPPGIAIATKTLCHNRTNQLSKRKQLVEDLGLTPKTRHSRLEGVQTIHLPRLPEPYPPAQQDIYETEKIAKIWKDYREMKKHPDPRSGLGGWPELEKLDPSKLTHTIAADESIIIRDRDSGTIAVVVLRNFSGNQDVLDWVNSIVDENVGLRRGIRVCVLVTPILGY